MVDGVTRARPRVLCLGTGYAVRYAGWVLRQAGFEVEDGPGSAAAGPPTSGAPWRDDEVAGLLRRFDVCITDAARLLVPVLGGGEPWPADLTRLVVVDIGSPADAEDANARIAELCGIGAVIGEPDGPGLAPPGRMLEAIVGLQSATAALAGWLGACRDGVGEHVHVDPVRCLAVMSGVNAVQFLNYGRPWRRAGRSASGSGGPFPFRMFRCRDGWVVVICRSLGEWDDFVAMLGHPPWSAEERFADPLHIASHHADEATALVTEILSQRDVADVVAAARRHRVPLAPLRSLEEALGDERLFAEAGRPEPVPAVTVSRRHPSSSEWFRRPRPRVRLGATGPLAGLRVLDLGWVWAAPIASAWLADLGADVVKVESLGSLDVARRRGLEFPAGGAPSTLPGYERAWLFNATNRNKRSVRLELKDPDDREVFLDLVDAADVVVESFSEGVMERLGIAPEVLLERNPALLVLSMGGRTVDGQYAARSYAPILTALAGIEGMVRDADDQPLGLLTWGVADPNAGAWSTFAVVAALARGEGGVHLLVSQLRALVNTCLSAYRGADPPRAELPSAQEVTAAHLDGTAPGPLGDVYRRVLTSGWSPQVGVRRAFVAPWEFSRMRVEVAAAAPLLGSTAAADVVASWVRQGRDYPGPGADAAAPLTSS